MVADLYCNMTYNLLQLKKIKVVIVVAIKSSNVVARVEPDVKEKAEAVLSKLGISVSSAINMFYRQIILWKGLPFRPAVPVGNPVSNPDDNTAGNSAGNLIELDEMTKEEFDAKMARGLAQAKNGEGVPADEFLKSLEKEVLETFG